MAAAAALSSAVNVNAGTASGLGGALDVFLAPLGRRISAVITAHTMSLSLQAHTLAAAVSAAIHSALITVTTQRLIATIATSQLAAEITINGEATTTILVEGDTAPTILGTITDDVTGLPVNLTNCTVKFQMRGANDRHYRINAACSIVSPTAGTVSYTPVAADLKVPGEYIAQFEVTFAGGAVQTTAVEIPITVRRQ